MLHTSPKAGETGNFSNVQPNILLTLTRTPSISYVSIRPKCPGTDCSRSTIIRQSIVYHYLRNFLKQSVKYTDSLIVRDLTANIKFFIEDKIGRDQGNVL